MEAPIFFFIGFKIKCEITVGSLWFSSMALISKWYEACLGTSIRAGEERERVLTYSFIDF